MKGSKLDTSSLFCNSDTKILSLPLHQKRVILGYFGLPGTILLLSVMADGNLMQFIVSVVSIVTLLVVDHVSCEFQCNTN
jgi:hypothetical protein